MKLKQNRIRLMKRLGMAILTFLLISGSTVSSISTFPERTINNPYVKNDISPKLVNTNTILSSGIITNDLDSGLTPTDLVNNLLGGGIAISNIQFAGANKAAGTFTGGTGIIGFEKGIILSSGYTSNVKGPNVYDSITVDNNLKGDIDLDGLIPGYTTYDATVLEFDFIPFTNKLQFKYVFSSDEYNEFVSSAYNDVFGFFVNGQNIALIPGTFTPVSINNVNCGNPYDGTNSCVSGTNPLYYINNDLSDGGGTINTEMDGLTIVMTAIANVNVGQTNHIKLAIADAGDQVLDSNVFIEAGSLTSEPPAPTENHAPKQPTGLNQYKSDGTTQTNVGGTTDERTVIFSANVEDPDNDKVKLQVELRRTDEYGGNFDENQGGLKEGDLVASGGVATASAIDLIDSNYHWRARTIDGHGEKSEWVEFGNNPILDSDFTVLNGVDTIGQEFTFAQLTDVHIGYDAAPEDVHYKLKGTALENGPAINRIWRFVETLRQINLEKPKPKFLLITGDDVNYSAEPFFDKYMEILKMNGIPYYNVAGNHDSSIGQRNCNPESDDDLVNYHKYVNPLNDYKFDYGIYRFVGLYSGKCYDNSSVYLVDGLTEQQMSKLKNELGDNTKKQVIFMHTPLKNLKPDIPYGGGNTKDAFLDYIKGNNVQLVLSGHYHFDEIRDSTNELQDINSQERPLFVTTRSATVSGTTWDGYYKDPMVKPRTDHYGYRIFRGGSSGVTIYPSTETLPTDKTSITVYSPVDIQVYDSQNRMTGISNFGTDQNIPDSFYIKESEDGSVTMPQMVLLYEPSNSYYLKIVSNFTKQKINSPTDSFDLIIMKQIGNYSVSIKYLNVNILDATIAKVFIDPSSTIYTMYIDIDGNGVTDQTKLPDAIIDNSDIISPTTTSLLSGTPGTNGWYVSDIQINLMATDDEGGSDVAKTEYSINGDANWILYSGQFSISNEGTTTISYRSTDNAGNIEETKIQTVKIDKTSPLVTIKVPTGEYLLNQQVLADWTAGDLISGVSSGIGTKQSGEALDTATVGTKTFTVDAEDNAGNSATKTVTYHIVYNFTGFFQPIENLPLWNSVKAGSAVPTKFSLFGNQGLDIFATSYPTSQKINCDSNILIDGIEETVTAGSSSLSFNATADQYNYVWKTEKAWSGTCRQLAVRLKDGTYHNASFRFLK